MANLFARFMKDESGATAIEYGRFSTGGAAFVVSRHKASIHQVLSGDRDNPRETEVSWHA